MVCRAAAARRRRVPVARFQNCARKSMFMERLNFRGSSMLPVLRPGDEILVDFTNRAFENGDILLVRASEDDQWFAHRLVTIDKKKFLKGDRSTTREDIDDNRIWGEIVGFRRGTHTVVWGDKGQPFKKLFAWLSAKNGSAMMMEGDNPLDGALLDEKQRLVQSALQQLPQDQQIIIRVAYFEGLSQSEIAERYSIPLGTVKTRMRLAMKKLHELLREAA